MAEKVEVYDLAAGQLTEIPASELAPGMVLAEIAGVGKAFIRADQIQPSPRKVDAPLPAAFEPVAKAVWELLKARVLSVAPTSEAWIDEFRRDAHPVKELTLWMRLSVAYDAMTHGGKDADEVASEVYAVLVSAMSNGNAALETVNLKRISRARARAVIERDNATTAQDVARFWAARLEKGLLDKLLDPNDS